MTQRTFMPIMISPEDQARERRGERLVRVKQVPWAIFTSHHETWSQRNHSQSLERIAQRGGFSACEMVAVLCGMPWQAMAEERAHHLLYAIVVAFNRGGLLAIQEKHPAHGRRVTEAA